MVTAYIPSNLETFISCLCREIVNDGGLTTKLYHKIDDLGFPILNLPFLCSNRSACLWNTYPLLLFVSYHDFIDKWFLLTRKLLNEEFQVVSWNHHYENFKNAIISWMTGMKNLFQRWRRIWINCRYNNSVLFSTNVNYH